MYDTQLKLKILNILAQSGSSFLKKYFIVTLIIRT